MEIIVQYVIGIGIIGLTSALVPFITADTVQFGVRIPPAHTNSPAIARVRKTYFIVWALMMAAALVVSITIGVANVFSNPAGQAISPGNGSGVGHALSALSQVHEAMPIVVLVAMVVLNYVNYYFARRRLLTAKEAEGWYEGVTEGLVADTTAHRKHPGPSLLWSVPNAVVTVIAIILPAIQYGKLPQQVAIHFNAAGVPNGFASKGFWSVFGPSVMQVVLFVVMVLVQLSLHRFAVRLDPSNPDASRHRYTVLQREGVKAIWMMLTFVSAGMTVTLLPIWFSSLNQVSTMATLGTALILVGVFVALLWIARAARNTREIGGARISARSGVVARDDDKFWVGGAFYFNRNDAALFVPKRFGIGVTVNFGHPIAWILTLVIVGTPIVISVSRALTH